MSITDPGSVLIIGAGASVDFGMPLGGNLIEEITNGLHAETEMFLDYGTSVSRTTSWTKYLQQADSHLINPIKAYLTLQEREASPDNSTSLVGEKVAEIQKKADRLRSLLNNQTSETIDDFIAQNTGYAEITKRCISALFVSALYHSSGNHGRALVSNDISQRTTQSGIRNWIHLLINIVRHEIGNNHEISPDNRIKIVSFNYDGILERVLRDQFFNTEKLIPAKESGASIEDYFEIVHPHGYCGDIQPNLECPWKTALEWSKNICVVNEPNVPPHIAGARERAHEIIKNAEHVYAIGFAFSGPNCKMLGLDKIEESRSRSGLRALTYHNYNNDIGLRLAVQRYVKVSKYLSHDDQAKLITVGATDSAERKLTITDWIKAGYLGEMPG